MSGGALTALIIGAVVLVVAAVVIALVVVPQMRRRRLRQRFGPEYDRAVDSTGSRKEAEQELADREKRHQELELRELSHESRERYAREWRQVQEHFVDDPQKATGEADLLITMVMSDRGYPTEGYEQQAADLSVEHARTLDHYRQAHGVMELVQRNGASTEDLRQAMVHYRAVFADLVGGDLARIGTDDTTRSTDSDDEADNEARYEADRDREPTGARPADTDGVRTTDVDPDRDPTTDPDRGQSAATEPRTPRHRS